MGSSVLNLNVLRGMQEHLQSAAESIGIVNVSVFPTVRFFPDSFVTLIAYVSQGKEDFARKEI